VWRPALGADQGPDVFTGFEVAFLGEGLEDLVHLLPVVTLLLDDVLKTLVLYAVDFNAGLYLPEALVDYDL